MPKTVAAPLLPAEPLTKKQRKLFDDHVQLAKKVASFEARKYSKEARPMIQQYALCGLYGAAARYREDGAASFKTYAIITMKWMIKIEFKFESRGKWHSEEELERKRSYNQRLRQNAIQTRRTRYEPSSYRATGELPEVAWKVSNDPDQDSEPVPYTTETPEKTLAEAQYNEKLHRIVDAVRRTTSTRDFRIFEGFLQGKPLSELGKAHGISRERARQLNEKTLKRVRARVLAACCF